MLIKWYYRTSRIYLIRNPVICASRHFFECEDAVVSLSLIGSFKIASRALEPAEGFIEKIDTLCMGTYIIIKWRKI